MANPSTINERLAHLIKSLGLSKNAFADKTDLSSALISKITTSEINFGVEVIKKITVAFPHVSLTWLLEGNGDMFTSPEGAGGANVRMIQKATELITPTSELIKDLHQMIADHKYDLGRAKDPRKVRHQIRSLQFFNSLRHHLEHLEVLKGGSNG